MYPVAAPRDFGAGVPVQYKHHPLLSCSLHRKRYRKTWKTKSKYRGCTILAALGQNTNHDIMETFQLVYPAFQWQH